MPDPGYDILIAAAKVECLTDSFCRRGGAQEPGMNILFSRIGRPTVAYGLDIESVFEGPRKPEVVVIPYVTQSNLLRADPIPIWGC